MSHSHSFRVAHVGGYARESASGPHKAIVGILQHLPRHGVDVELWQFVRNAKEITRRDVDGIPLLELPARGPLDSFAIGLPNDTKNFLRSSVHVDLVHFHSVFIAENARAGPLLPVPYVISPRGGYSKRVLHGRNRLAKKIWLMMFERRYLQAASALHAVSEGEGVELKRLVPSERIFYVPNGIDQQVLDRPIREPFGKTLLFLGRLAVKHKGIDLLLEGYSKFLRDDGDDESNLVLAGPDFRGDRQRIEDHIRVLDLQDRVSLPGGVFGAAKWNLIETSFAFVLTSRWEGMPFALLEALAAGRPVLVTPETNMGALVGEYRAGIQVMDDPQEVAEGIRGLLALQEEEYETMQHQARSLVQDRFTWDRIAGDMATCYREILAAFRDPSTRLDLLNARRALPRLERKLDDPRDP